MNFKTIAVLPIFVSLLLIGCSKNDDKDDLKPVIDLSNEDAFPVQCDTLYFGESITIRILFTDNKELGSYSLDIHNNFDHHSHSTEVEECHQEPIKVPVNPYVFIQDYSIPGGMTRYETDLVLDIPNGQYDEGDYHFYIRLTNKEGWSAQKGLSIKMMNR